MLVQNDCPTFKKKLLERQQQVIEEMNRHIILTVTLSPNCFIGVRELAAVAAAAL